MLSGIHLKRWFTNDSVKWSRHYWRRPQILIIMELCKNRRTESHQKMMRGVTWGVPESNKLLPWTVYKFYQNDESSKFDIDEVETFVDSAHSLDVENVNNMDTANSLENLIWENLRKHSLYYCVLQRSFLVGSAWYYFFHDEGRCHIETSPLISPISWKS